MKSRRLVWHFYPAFLILIVTTALLCSWYVAQSMRSAAIASRTAMLTERAALLRSLLKQTDVASDLPKITKRTIEAAEITESRIVIFDAAGSVLVDSNASLSPGKLLEQPDVKTALEREHGSYVEAQHGESPSKLHVSLQLSKGPLAGSVLRISSRLDRLQDEIAHIQRIILGGGLIVLLVAGLLCWLLVGGVSRPLTRLADGVKRFAEGDLTFRVPSFEWAELQTLSSVLNQMARKLKEEMDRVREQRNEANVLLASMGEGLIAVDKNERVINLNPKAEQLLGVQIEKARGRSIQEVIRNSHIEAILLRALDEQVAFESEIQTVKPEERLLLGSTNIIRNASGECAGALLVLRDITQLKRLENLRRDFAANVSHELRTPITSIKGFAETLLSGTVEDPDDVNRFLGIIQKQSERLNAIIEDLLSLAQLEQGDDEKLEVNEVNLRRLINSVVSSCTPQTKDKKLAVSVQCSEDLTARVNPSLFEQAVFNLVDNAIKYSGPESQIEIFAAIEGDMVRLSVRDTGPGIAESHLERIFERFYRVDRGRSRSQGGTGLGLAIVKHIAKAHGGYPSVTSAPGKGSTFSITVPRHPTQ